jgi:hypothetical protein
MCRQTLLKRRDYSEKLSVAFEELIIQAQVDEAETESSVDSLLESGIYYSAQSSFHSELAEAIAGLVSREVGSSEHDGPKTYESQDSARVARFQKLG